MHAYSLDPIQEQNREKVNRVLFGVSVILTPIFNKLLVWIVRLVQAIPFGESVIDWLIDFGFTMSISYIMTYAMLFLLVDRLLWCTLLSKALAIPNVKGVWKGTLHSNYNGGKDIDITLIIKQTLTKISCVAQFQDSSSSSDMSKLVWINGDEIQLSFAFQNKSRATPHRK
ncbi:MAG: hypothetical protein II885_09825 [Oscillospiraceae bacterium]|nr:hypothetical protein [Oscillospiraceae bacterium]